MNVLFVCSRNRLRSPTAEAVFQGVGGLACASAGTAADAEEALSQDHLDWADIVVALEPRHRKAITKKFPAARDKKIVALGIPDDYDLMAPELVELLWSRRAPLLGVARPNDEPGQAGPSRRAP